MEIKLNVRRAVVVSTSGTDKALLFTDHPSSCFPWEAPLVIHFDAAKGSGVRYLKENFPGVPVEERGG